MSVMTADRCCKLLVLAGGAAAAVGGAVPAAAREAQELPPAAMGMLYDTTLCIGCKTCVVACSEANDLEPDPGPGARRPLRRPGRSERPAPRTSSSSTRTSDVPLLHEGAVHALRRSGLRGRLHARLAARRTRSPASSRYDPDYCVGCRYCQMSCPFNIPKFEFDKAAPKIVKCELCRHRIKDEATIDRRLHAAIPKGQGPACCEVCPREAVIYGKRDELLAEAKRRIAANPGRYYEDRVYGETDGGGTQVLYLVPRALREARPARASATRACRTSPTRSRRASTTRASSPRWRSTRRWPRSCSATATAPARRATGGGEP